MVGDYKTSFFLCKCKTLENEFHFRKSAFHRFLRLFAVGRPELRQEYQLVSQHENNGVNGSGKLHSIAQRRREEFINDCSWLLFCFLGIQVKLETCISSRGDGPLHLHPMEIFLNFLNFEKKSWGTM